MSNFEFTLYYIKVSRQLKPLESQINIDCMLFTKQIKDLTDEEYILKYCFIYLNMRKVKEESIEKILTHEDNK